MTALAVWNDIDYKTCELIDWHAFKEQGFVVFRTLYAIHTQPEANVCIQL